MLMANTAAFVHRHHQSHQPSKTLCTCIWKEFNVHSCSKIWPSFIFLLKNTLSLSTDFNKHQERQTEDNSRCWWCVSFLSAEKQACCTFGCCRVCQFSHHDSVMIARYYKTYESAVRTALNSTSIAPYITDITVEPFHEPFVSFFCLTETRDIMMSAFAKAPLAMWNLFVFACHGRVCLNLHAIACSTVASPHHRLHYS